MTGEWPLAIGIISLFVAIGNLVHNRFIVEASNRERLRALEETDKRIETLIGVEIKEVIRRLVDLESHTKDVPVIKMQLGLFWKAVEAHVPDLLLHPDSQDRDVLIMKAKNKNLTAGEAETLKAILEVELKHLPKDSIDSWPTFAYIVYCDYLANGVAPR